MNVFSRDYGLDNPSMVCLYGVPYYLLRFINFVQGDPVRNCAYLYDAILLCPLYTPVIQLYPLVVAVIFHNAARSPKFKF